MASLDVLDTLFAVEHEAEVLLDVAHAEAEGRIAAAKERAAKELGAVLETATAEASKRRLEALAAVEYECRQLLDGYRRELAELPIDEEAFRFACERVLSGGPP